MTSVKNIRGGGINSLLRRNLFFMRNEDEKMKEWSEILNYDFDESGTLPEAIDVSNYTDFLIVGIGLINGSSSDSSLNCCFGDVTVRLDTGKSGSNSSATQNILGHYNGLFFEQLKLPKCMNNNGAYDTTYANVMRPYTHRLNPKISPLTFKYSAGIYALISGNVTIYAR